jgi:exopolysaccharide production protein ExoZ
VVAHHIIFSLNDYIAHLGVKIEAGARGVDIFFVISGFIMAATTAARPTNPGTFALNRIVRVAPLYWLLTLIAVGLDAGGVEIFGGHFRLGAIVRALLFINDPAWEPPLFVGWTLNYEMAFYALFSLCLFIPNARRRAWAIIAAITALWGGGVAAGAGSALLNLGNDIILEFALGVALWMLSTRFTASKPLGWALLGLGLFGLVLPDLTALPDWPVIPATRLVVGLSAFAVVFGAISLEARGEAIKNRAILLQGDASYSIYLLHPFILQFVGKAAMLAHLTESTPGLVLTVAAMGIAVAAIATPFHLWVEVPLTALLKARLISRPSASSPIPPWR